MLNKVLLLVRKNCDYSKKIYYFLKKNSNKLDVYYCDKLNEKFPKKFENKTYQYILSFRSYIILKEKHIKNCEYFPINFHPGTPKYRGFGCANFAIMNNETEYGSTAHIIDKKIDFGKILNVKKFNINSNYTIDDLLSKTHKNMYFQAIKLFKQILKGDNYENIISKQKKIDRWSSKYYTKKDIDKLYTINLNITKKRLDKIIQATSSEHYKPFILFHKRKFELKNED